MYLKSKECYVQPSTQSSKQHIAYQTYNPVSNKTIGAGYGTHSIASSELSKQGDRSVAIGISSGQGYKTVENFQETKKDNTNLHLTWKHNAYPNTVNPTVWGPAFWFTLHNSASKYPINASPVTKERMKGFILGLTVILPCEACKVHATNHIESNKNNLDDICSGRDKLFKFFVDFHNMVNKRYNKKEMSYEDAYKLYSGESKVSVLSY